MDCFSWPALVGSRRFWIGYIGAGIDLDDCPGIEWDFADPLEGPEVGATLTLRLPGRHRLRLDVRAGEHRLEIFYPDDPRPVLLGVMDAHPMGDLFRWEEYRALAGYLGRAFGPPWAFDLLFSTYTAILAGEADEHDAVLRRALAASGLFAGAEIDEIARGTRRAAVRRDFRWVEVTGLGWTAVASPPCRSARQADGRFDFARFGAFLAALEAAG